MKAKITATDELMLKWATPLLLVDFEGVERLNEELAALILRNEAQFSKKALPIKHTPQYWSRFSSFHYRQDFFARKNKAVRVLDEMIVDAVKRFGVLYFKETPLVISRLSGWANINRRGDWHGPHNHYSGGQFLSGVYWVSHPHKPSDMFDLDGNLVFHDPRGSGCPAKYDLVLEAVPGRMVLQPAWLSHTVTPKRSAGMRMSIAFDVFVENSPWWNSKAQIV